MTFGLLFALRVWALDAPLARCHDHFYNLEYEPAIACFEKAIARQPGSPELHNHLAASLLFREMYRSGALESELVGGSNAFLRRPKLEPAPETELRFFNEISRAMSLANERLAGDECDIPALYALGISHGLRANYYWLVRKAWRDSLRDATAGRKLHNQISDMDPDNVDARLTQGLHDYIVGSLPLVYRMLGFITGFHGDKEKGIRTVEYVAAHGNANRVDARIFLSALYRREGQPRRAIPVIEDLIHRYPRNPLLRFELAQMFSDAGDGIKAAATVREIAALKHKRAPGFATLPWEKIWFQQGTIAFWYNDLPCALENLTKVTASGDELDLNTGVLAWMRLGQIYDLSGHRTLAADAYRKAIAFAPEAEAARESRRYLSAPYRRTATRP